ncbi:hypothetical protein BGZ83_011088 [Gryganskiella cystojenkinii]|nr:hypothetical protein BGZ83_011088 [Gryganskiella cystojenkinii]
MKFGKALETNAESMPEGWRPYVIHYKALKKKINAIVKELDDRGLPSPIIKNLLNKSMSGDMQRLEYSFDENDDKRHLKTCIKVVLDDIDPASGSTFGPAPLSQEEKHLSRLFAHELAFLNSSASSSSSDLHEQLMVDSTEDEESLGRSESLEDLLDDTTVSESSEDTPSLSEEDALTPDESSSKGQKDTDSNSNRGGLLISGVFSNDESGVTTLTTATTATTSSAPASGTSTALVGDVTTVASGLNAQKTDPSAHGPSSGTSTPSPPSSPILPTVPVHLTARPSTPSPLSQPPLRPGDLISSTSPPTSSHASDLSTSSSSLINATASSIEPMETIVTPGSAALLSEASPSTDSSNTHIHTTEEDGKRVLVIELTADTAFFDQLGEEVSQLSKLQQANKKEFESKVEDLGKVLTVVSSPHNKDMYTWREILKIYLDAQVFVGDQESDRSTRSSEKAQTQLQWFLKEMDRSKLVHKFKQSKSKVAFNTFFQLNSELITMKQFKELNQMAMTKILKKHDKRTNLTASSGFPKHLQNEPFYNDNISKSLTYTIGCQLVSIIPQPDDYACPICMCKLLIDVMPAA